MNQKQIAEKIYLENGLRDLAFLNSVFHEDLLFEWHSSQGYISKNKTEVLELCNELNLNYKNLQSDIIHIVEENNKVVVAYNHYASTIETESEIHMIGRFITIWEFQDDKIIKGYQISRPA